MRRDVILNATNPAAIAWAKSQASVKAGMLVVQLLIIAMGCYRMKQVFIGPLLADPTVFVIFGFAHRAVALIMAWCAWDNSRAFERLRDGN